MFSYHNSTSSPRKEKLIRVRCHQAAYLSDPVQPVSRFPSSTLLPFCFLVLKPNSETTGARIMITLSFGGKSEPRVFMQGNRLVHMQARSHVQGCLCSRGLSHCPSGFLYIVISQEAQKNTILVVELRPLYYGRRCPLGVASDRKLQVLAWRTRI